MKNVCYRCLYDKVNLELENFDDWIIDTTRLIHTPFCTLIYFNVKNWNTAIWLNSQFNRQNCEYIQIQFNLIRSRIQFPSMCVQDCSIDCCGLRPRIQNGCFLIHWMDVWHNGGPIEGPPWTCRYSIVVIFNEFQGALNWNS